MKKLFFICSFLILQQCLCCYGFFTYDYSNRSKGSIQIAGDLSINGNFTSNNFMTSEILATKQMNSSEKLTTDSLKYTNGYIDDIYVDYIQGINGKLTIEGDLYLTSYLSEDIEATSFILQDIRQWELTHHDDFDSKESLKGWSMNITSTCKHQSKNRFLGGHCILSNDEVAKHYEGLPEHKTLRINANIHFFDLWEGENVYLKIDDEIVWFKSAKSSKSEHAINICGGDKNDPKFAMPLDYIISHNASNVKIGFGSTLQKDACTASFAIDDVMLYVK